MLSALFKAVEFRAVYILKKIVLQILSHSFIIHKGTDLKVVIKTAIVKIYRTDRRYIVVTDNTLAVDESSLVKIHLDTHLQQITEIRP